MRVIVREVDSILTSSCIIHTTFDVVSLTGRTFNHRVTRIGGYILQLHELLIITITTIILIIHHHLSHYHRALSELSVAVLSQLLAKHSPAGNLSGQTLAHDSS